uniref:Uncharacterized protein n=1 Tax=Triticum urartu TaxID=4572 RepID=A0A8R7P978_TRIUA
MSYSNAATKRAQQITTSVHLQDYNSDILLAHQLTSVQLHVRYIT